MCNVFLPDVNFKISWPDKIGSKDKCNFNDEKIFHLIDVKKFAKLHSKFLT